MSIPNLNTIDAISAVRDPVIRNLQITQCYSELSTVLAARTGPAANWCTFATWASKQAGSTIRKEDLARSLKEALSSSPETVKAAGQMHTPIQDAQIGENISSTQPFGMQGILTRAVNLASDAIGRGNLKVFDEIGREFARFYAICLSDETPDDAKLARFCAELRDGDPPGGQTYLRKAFTHYYQSFFEEDPKAKAELILLANIEIGAHEQTRLQPEIAAGVDAGLNSSLEFTRGLLARMFPVGGWLALSHLYLMRLLGRPTKLDQAVRTLVEATRTHLRHRLTESVLTIRLPDQTRLKLGADVGAIFPDTLLRIQNPELRDLIARFDPTPDSPAESGALDWVNLKERLHFIIDLFRSFQETPDLHLPPFTPAQVAEIKADRLPGGDL